MVFGVPWNKQGDAAAAQRSGDELLVTARNAAEQLVGDLERARQLTRDWADERLADALVETALSTSLHVLARTGCWGEANRLPSGEFWRIAGPVLSVGRLQLHARLKPRGYAGDYQMLDWICSGDCCEHPLGRTFDRYFQAQAAPQAVRSRTQQTAAALASYCLQSDAARLHVVSVGAGPAIDVAQGLSLLSEEHRARLLVTLLDLDPEALESARRRLQPRLPPDAVECIRENLVRLPERRQPEKLLGSPSFLICTGLFDYLDDERAADMLRLLWQRLSAGGRLLVGNFMPHNPTRAYMEWIGNWYLIYRTADDLERLAVRAGIPGDSFAIAAETLGVDLFLVASKPPG